MLAGVVAGCSTPPAISVQGVDRTASDGSAEQFAIRLRMANPTDDPIRLDTFEYSLNIGGSDPYHGTWVAARTIPARTAIDAVVPAVLSPGPGIGSEVRWHAWGSVRYFAPDRLAQVLLDVGVQTPSASFDGSGTGVGDAPAPPSAPADSARVPGATAEPIAGTGPPRRLLATEHAS